MNRVVLAFIGGVAASSSVALAGPWESFIFGDAGSTSGPYTITLTDAEPALDITDAYLSGDRFRVDFTTGESLLTSVPGTIGDDIGGDFDSAFVDPRYSHGSIYMGAGTHTFNITAVDSPFGSGGAAYRSGVIPAPGAIALLGLAGLTARRRR